MTKILRTIENEGYFLTDFDGLILKMEVFSVKTQLHYLTNLLHVSVTVCNHPQADDSR